MTRRNDKRPRLIAAADTLFLQQGVNTTTLADIASLAQVPLGNVYYYFKSKEAIILAVLQRSQQHLKERLTQINTTFQEPRARLAAYLDVSMSESEQVVAYGDPLGSLCQELSKQPMSEVTQAAQTLMQTLAEWMAQQFKTMGHQQPNLQARQFLATIMGSKLLALSFKGSHVLVEQLQQLKNQLMQAP